MYIKKYNKSKIPKSFFLNIPDSSMITIMRMYVRDGSGVMKRKLACAV